MELFSEIYNCYYSAVNEILNRSPLSETDIKSIINDKAFSESWLYIIPKLTEEWGFMQKSDNTYSTSLNPKMPVTLLEKAFIKAILNDKRIKLFLDDSTISELNENLSDTPALFDHNHFNYFDIFSDGDDYQSEQYIKNFRTLLSAMKEKRVVIIQYRTKTGGLYSTYHLPHKFEYSKKNDKFRLITAKLKRHIRFSTLNMSRIENVIPTDSIYQEPLRYKKTKSCVELEIYDQRNSLERFMLEFAGHEKHTELDEETKICTAKLWYDKRDETEILIQLLSFGPTLKITAPESFIQLAKECINKQYKLLFE